MFNKHYNLDFFLSTIIFTVISISNVCIAMEQLRLYFVTYNVGGKTPDQDLYDLLNLAPDPRHDSVLPDFYVIGLQEAKAQPQTMLLDALFDDPWTNQIRHILKYRDYIKVKTIRLQGLILVVFGLRRHLLHLRDIETSYTRTGLSGFWGNKGAVSIRFNIYGCSICVVNSHLAAHDEKLQERIEDYNAIVKEQEFHVRETSTIFFHDYVFWLGDLNFRLSNDGTLNTNEIQLLIKDNKFKQLLEKDQLRLVMESGDAFSELNETLPNFPPTFKFEVGTSTYDSKRRPAWCDRILYRVNKNNYENVILNLEQISYDSHSRYILSDHKPVTSDFKIKRVVAARGARSAGLTSIDSAAKSFQVFKDYTEREVEFVQIPIWYLDEVNSATVKLALDVEPTQSDWIGIFKDGFSGLDEYLSYVYVLRGSSPVPQPRRSQSAAQAQKIYTVQFPETTIRNPGMYRLVYFSETPQNVVSVLGMSDAFHIQPREEDVAVEAVGF